MSLESKILKIKENNTKDSLDSARFFLNYRQSKIPEEARDVSYEFLSVLKGASDVVVEINTNHLFSPPKPGSDIVQQYIHLAKNNGLEYKYRKIPVMVNQNILTKLFSSKKQEAQELVISIPSETWQSSSFKSIFNIYGTKYYFIDQPAPTILDDLPAMSDIEKLETSNFIVFDLGLLGNMGINTRKYNLPELKQLFK